LARPIIIKINEAFPNILQQYFFIRFHMLKCPLEVQKQTKKGGIHHEGAEIEFKGKNLGQRQH
jgi:hypothetical protein